MNVYDFDNTIYDGESAVDFLIFCIFKQKEYAKYLPLIAYTATLYKLRLLSLEKLNQQVGRISSLIISNQEKAEAYIKEFWDLHRHKLKKYYLDKIQQEDVIITASPRILIEGIIEELKTQNIICSEINLKTGRIEFICFQENKVLAFKKRYPNVKINEFYTDSFNDLPLMKLSRKPYLVSKKKEPQLIKRYAIK